MQRKAKLHQKKALLESDSIEQTVLSTLKAMKHQDSYVIVVIPTLDVMTMKNKQIQGTNARKWINYLSLVMQSWDH